MKQTVFTEVCSIGAMVAVSVPVIYTFFPVALPLSQIGWLGIGIAAGGWWMKQKLTPVPIEKKINQVINNCNLYIKKGDTEIKPKLVHKEETPFGPKLTYYLPPGLCLTDFEKHHEEFETATSGEVEMSAWKDKLTMTVLTGNLPKKVSFGEGLDVTDSNRVIESRDDI